MAALGNSVWGWYEVVLGTSVPSPSYADLFFLCFAPPAIVGLLVLAKRPANRAGWTRLALDSWLIGGSLLTLSWSLALAQAAKFDGSSVAHTALSLAYPLLDIALVSMVLALHFRCSSINRTAVNTAIGALALTVLCDALFTSPLLHNSYRSGQLLDAGWFAGSLLLAYAPWAAPRPGGPADERLGTDPYEAEPSERDGHRPEGHPSDGPDPDPRSAAGHARVADAYGHGPEDHARVPDDHVPGRQPGAARPMPGGPPAPGADDDRYPAAGPSPGPSPPSPRTSPRPCARWGSCTTRSSATASTAWC